MCLGYNIIGYRFFMNLTLFALGEENIQGLVLYVAGIIYNKYGSSLSLIVYSINIVTRQDLFHTFSKWSIKFIKNEILSLVLFFIPTWTAW